MGVYIPNMSKPKNCRTCKFKSNKEGECWFVHYDIDCPLIDIVQCKDCKWREKSGGILWCNIWHNDTNGLNFCSYAERGNDE